MNKRITGPMVLTLAGVLTLCAGINQGAWGQETDTKPAPAAQTQTLSADQAAKQAWAAAKAGDDGKMLHVLDELAPDNRPGTTELEKNLHELEKNIAKREETRKKKIDEASALLDKNLAKNDAKGLSEAVKQAVTIYVLSTDKAAFIAEPRVQGLIKQADAAAREAEKKGDWFTANELFYRLNALLEESGKYKPDVHRLALRLSMIRLYCPKEFWKLRNDERVEAKKSPLPAYNGLGEDYVTHLKGIDRLMVIRAMTAAAHDQIDHIPLRTTMLGGIDALRTMMTTSSLETVFPGLAKQPAREAMLAFLDRWAKELDDPGAIVATSSLISFLDDLDQTNSTTVDLPDNALLHEFGNGAIAKLDDFSALIWPDEVSRFDRMTQGNFRGVGVQIQLDDESQMIKVVTPIEGTPAQRAGIKAGDLIKKIDGQSAVGISVNQAVDLITGPEDTKVQLTMERVTGKDPGDGKDLTKDVDFSLTRALIPLQSVKGWRREGAKEDQWDWFIDPVNKIGYIRLLQFTEDTTSGLHKAIAQMEQAGGLRGLILDLRYNPGGLLTQAVGVANTFIDHGTIVSTEGTLPGEVHEATESGVMLHNVPMVVLINEGSASASEIVSGALKFYADKGDIPCVLMGQRSFGKGSVQNVWALAPNAKMKLTTQYYKLPDGRILHRRPGSKVWGVDPHVKVDDLPETELDAIKLRQDADTFPIDQDGHIIKTGTPRPDPEKLIDDGLDIQLQTALLLLQAKVSGSPTEQAQLGQ